MTRTFSPEQQHILDLLRDAPAPLTSPAIAATLRKSRVAVRFLLSKMARRGLIERAFTGQYTLPGRAPPPPPAPARMARAARSDVSPDDRWRCTCEIAHAPDLPRCLRCGEYRP
jgi:hypothetical protein